MPGPRSQSLADLLLKVAFVAGLVLITWLSLAAGTGTPQSGISDKVKHACAYTALGISGMFAFPGHPRGLASFLFGWGVLMEIGQGFVPLRTPEFADTLANLIGIALGWVIYRRATSQPSRASALN